MRIAISTHNQRAAAEKTRGEKRGNDASKQASSLAGALAFPLLAQWSGGRTHFARNNYYCFGEWVACERANERAMIFSTQAEQRERKGGCCAVRSALLL
jgi:hypothetical protein